jgi:hypothetical protein
MPPSARGVRRRGRWVVRAPPRPASEPAADARAATAVSASAAADSADVRRLRLCSPGDPRGLGFGLKSLSLLRDGRLFDLGREGAASASMAPAADGRPDDIVAARRGGAERGGARGAARRGVARRGRALRSFYGARRGRGLGRLGWGSRRGSDIA